MGLAADVDVVGRREGALWKDRGIKVWINAANNECCTNRVHNAIMQVMRYRVSPTPSLSSFEREVDRTIMHAQEIWNLQPPKTAPS